MRLGPHTSLRVGGLADWFVFARSGQDLADGLRWARDHDLPVRVIGGGLNLPFEGFHNLTTWLGHTLGEVEGEPLNLMVAGISTLLALAAIWLSWFLYMRKPLDLAMLCAVVLLPIFLLVISRADPWSVNTPEWRAAWVRRHHLRHRRRRASS